MKVDYDAKLRIVARSPFHVYFEGEGLAVSATNRIGDFDILPGHADFFSILQPGTVIVDKGDGSETVNFNVDNGILTVRNDEVLLFVNM